MNVEFERGYNRAKKKIDDKIRKIINLCEENSEKLWIEEGSYWYCSLIDEIKEKLEKILEE